MGQQQLLLLVLSVILVGLAVVGGLSAYNENVRKTRIDVATARAVEIVGRMQLWVKTPRSMGGGDGLGNPWANFRLEQMGIQPSGVCASGREFVRLPDGSQISIFGDGGNPVDGGILAWHPNGDCGQRWNWEFHIVSQSASLEGIQFIQCASGLRSWADGSQCPRW
ncbi:MAG TPA: hypothetical protein VGB53_06425 [Rubricoccaceae bacterium]|jgi:hypothetical protein